MASTRSTRSSANAAIPPPVPTRELSGRKRTPRTMGPDYVEDFFPGTARSTQAGGSDPIRKALRTAEKEDKVGVPQHPHPHPHPHLHPHPHQQQVVSEEKHSPEVEPPPQSQMHGRVPGDICQICLKKNPADVLVHCRGRGCRFEAHVACLKTSSSNWEFGMDSGPNFKCAKCKRCCICGKKKPADAESRSVTCVGCNRMFHMRCHFPQVSEKEDDWKCGNCSSGKPKAEKIDFSIRKSSRTTTTTKRKGDDLTSQLDDKASISTNDSKVREASSMSGDSDRVTEEKSVTGKSPVVNVRKGTRRVKREISREMEPASPLSERELTPEKERSLSPLPMNPQFAYLLELHQSKVNEERELRHDLALWSVEQCAAYFADSMPGLADLILEHELFGSSLMIISREQFYNLFGLPLGKNLLYFNAICKWRRTPF